MSTRTTTKVATHDTPPVIFDTLARLFEVKESEGHRWIEFVVDDVRVTFFATAVASLEVVA